MPLEKVDGTLRLFAILDWEDFGKREETKIPGENPKARHMVAGHEGVSDLNGLTCDLHTRLVEMNFMTCVRSSSQLSILTAMNSNSLEPPATPIMLYIGAGYDLSPLLTFAPGGSPYPIVPLGPDRARSYATLHPTETYTSFVFVDAKPRHTSAFMVPDFHEWKGIDERVRNVLHYSQGLLTRWRTVPGAPDLIWFEGGGHRVHDRHWHHSTTTTAAKVSSPRPLTTLFYLFNTLDLEITKAPLMENMWPRVQALYVHGLRIHHNTGAGMSLLPQTGTLGIGLKRCYVLVGSWGGKAGVRKVDFVKEARRRCRMSRLASLSSSSVDRPSSASTSSSSPFTSSSASVSCPTSSIPYTASSHPPSLSLSLASSSTSLSLVHSLKLNPSLTSSLHSFDPGSLPDIGTDSDTDSDSDLDLSSPISNSGIAIDEQECTRPPYSPFHTPIPQLSYSHTLQRYYVARTIPECVALVKAKRGRGGDNDTYGAYDDDSVENDTTQRQPHGGWEEREGERGEIMKPLWFGWLRSSRKEARLQMTTNASTTGRRKPVVHLGMDAESSLHRAQSDTPGDDQRCPLRRRTTGVHKVVRCHSKKKKSSRTVAITHENTGYGCVEAGADADVAIDPFPYPGSEPEPDLPVWPRTKKRLTLPMSSGTASLLAWVKGGVSVVRDRSWSWSWVILDGAGATATRTTDTRTAIKSMATNVIATATAGHGRL
ncbi:hypothetical protein BU17DRAFT_64325 [Hysterangium stoloniferum]|nr:hypothetical protein BU17DRAFT_64325 [Hysterangium stoloniferum]